MKLKSRTKRQVAIGISISLYQNLAISPPSVTTTAPGSTVTVGGNVIVSGGNVVVSVGIQNSNNILISATFGQTITTVISSKFCL